MRKKKPKNQQPRKTDLGKPTNEDILASQVGRGVIYPIVDEQSGKPTGLYLTQHRKPERHPRRAGVRYPDGTKYTRESAGKRRQRERARNRVASAERRRQRRDHR